MCMWQSSHLSCFFPPVDCQDKLDVRHFWRDYALMTLSLGPSVWWPLRIWYTQALRSRLLKICQNLRNSTVISYLRIHQSYIKLLSRHSVPLNLNITRWCSKGVSILRPRINATANQWRWLKLQRYHNFGTGIPVAQSRYRYRYR